LKYALIADIHSNLDALKAVLDEVERLKCGTIICLGDIVGYGAEPNECVQLLREKSVTSVNGNHDKAACGIREPYNFNPTAREAALWTRDVLTEENRGYLKNLPEKVDYGDFIAVHGAVSDPDKYILSVYEAESEFELFGGAALCFFGHTHVRAVYAFRDGSACEAAGVKVKPDKNALRLDMDKDTKYLINPGSVGQPRDRDPRASYLVYERGSGVEFRRVEYDIESAQNKILEAGLSKALAQRLKYGY
jgi:predicted phosphodiesterase